MFVQRKDNRIHVSLTMKEAASICKHRTRGGWMTADVPQRPLADSVFAKSFRTNLAKAILRTGIFDGK